MKKIINKNLYIRSLKELTYTTVIMTAIAIAILFMKHNGMDYMINSYYFSSGAYNPSDISLFFMMIFTSFALSYVSLWFARDKKNADYVYSLPYTKGQIYTSKFAAVFTMQLAASLFIVLFGAIVSFELLGKIAFVGDMMLVLVHTMIGSIVVMGAIFLSASVTGKSLSVILLSGFLVILPAVPYISISYTTIRVADAFFTDIYRAGYSIYSIPNFLNSIAGGYVVYRNIIPMIVTLLIGILYTGFGYYLFNKRSGELTGAHTKNIGIHMLVMGIIPMLVVYWMVITTSLGVGIIPPELKNVLLTLLLALMFAVLYEVIVNRSLNKVLRSFLVLVCSVIFVSAIHFSSAAKAKYDMEQKIEYTDVESINFVSDTYVYSDLMSSRRLSYGEYLVSSIDITDEEIIKYILEKADSGYPDTDVGFIGSQLVRMNLKSGGDVYRQIYLNIEIDEDNEIKRDIDVVFAENPRFYDYINAGMPSEYVTFIYNEYYYDIIYNQEIMKDIYGIFSDEYGKLSMEEQSDYRTYGQNYSYGDGALSKDDNERPIGVLYVSGRINDRDIIDIYEITRNTEETANKYIQMANESNLINFSNLYYDNIENDKVLGDALLLRVEYFNDENEVYSIFAFYRDSIQPNVIPAEQEYILEAMEVLLSEDITTPEADEEFAKVTYYDYKTRWRREVFLPISQNQIEKLISINEKMHK